MLKIVGIMLLGVFTGYLLKNYQLRWVQKWIMLAIWLLLFLLGIAVGTNGEIMNNLDTIGLKGLILAWEEYGKCDPGLGGIFAFFHDERRVLCFLSISKSLF